MTSVRPGGLEARLKRPAKVGVRRRFIRDPALAAEYEQRISRYENDAIAVLRSIGARWPIPVEGRITIAFLIGIHLWRNPAGLDRLTQLQLFNIDRRLAEYRRTMSSTQIEQLIAEVTSERYRVGYLLQTLPRVASMLLSMYWSLVEFDEPLLATSDQPVMVFPLLEVGHSVPIAPLPPSGLIDTEEIRMPVGPHHALVLTWPNQPDETEPVAGTDEIASELNRAVIAQADREWFHRPGRRPTTLRPYDFGARHCTPVGRLILSDYDAQVAAISPRRQHTLLNLNHMIEEDLDDQVIISRVQRLPA